MSPAELDESLAWLVSEPADALCDMGGDLIAAAAAAGHRPAGALEATTTGLHRLHGLEIPFPVLDWNGAVIGRIVSAEARPCGGGVSVGLTIGPAADPVADAPHVVTQEAARAD